MFITIVHQLGVWFWSEVTVQCKGDVSMVRICKSLRTQHDPHYTLLYTPYYLHNMIPYTLLYTPYYPHNMIPYTLLYTPYYPHNMIPYTFAIHSLLSTQHDPPYTLLYTPYYLHNMIPYTLLYTPYYLHNMIHLTPCYTLPTIHTT